MGRYGPLGSVSTPWGNTYSSRESTWHSCREYSWYTACQTAPRLSILTSWKLILRESTTASWYVYIWSQVCTIFVRVHQKHAWPKKRVRVLQRESMRHSYSCQVTWHMTNISQRMTDVVSDFEEVPKCWQMMFDAIIEKHRSHREVFGQETQQQVRQKKGRCTLMWAYKGWASYVWPLLSWYDPASSVLYHAACLEEVVCPSIHRPSDHISGLTYHRSDMSVISDSSQSISTS